MRKGEPLSLFSHGGTGSTGFFGPLGSRCLGVLALLRPPRSLRPALNRPFRARDYTIGGRGTISHGTPREPEVRVVQTVPYRERIRRQRNFFAGTVLANFNKWVRPLYRPRTGSSLYGEAHVTLPYRLPNPLPTLFRLAHRGLCPGDKSPSTCFEARHSITLSEFCKSRIHKTRGP